MALVFGMILSLVSLVILLVLLLGGLGASRIPSPRAGYAGVGFGALVLTLGSENLTVFSVCE